MKRIGLFLIVFFLGCDSPTKELRTINICVLNDNRAPIRDTSSIRKSIDGLSTIYKEKVGIAFNVSEFRDYSGQILEPIGFMKYGLSGSIGAACSYGSEIAILFTNHSKEEILGFQYNDALAEALWGKPVIVVYKSEVLPSYFNSELHPLVLLLMHETGHFFVGSSHSPDTLSFMFEYANKSYGKWTKRDKKNVLRNKYREFVLSPN